MTDIRSIHATNRCQCPITYQLPSKSRPGAFHTVTYDPVTKNAFCDQSCAGQVYQGKCWHVRRVLAKHGHRAEFEGNQEEQVLAYMKFYGSIDQNEALTYLGIQRLGARIFHLRKKLKDQGLYIDDERVDVPTRFGDESHISVYTLHKLKNEWTGRF